ncbi:MAG TPA: hypothetical protein VK428_15895 [Acidimicrobiales bacterium]|nr:hypothetical protein [Acidimicrobiales bacterium]
MSRVGARLAAASSLILISGVAVMALSAPSAFADTSSYELYCPGTPVGNIALNNVVTTGTITPASPAAGSTFNLTNYQTTVSVPSSLVSAAAALGNTAIAGSSKVTIDASGATPATLAGPAVSFSDPIPSPVPSSGLALQLPSPAGTIGPFTASGGAITLSQDKSASLTLEVSGNPLTLTCTAYANNTVASGITTSAPSGSPVSPPIATTSAGAASSSSTPSSTPSTTAAPATASSGSTSLPSTGAGPGLRILALIGFVAIVAAGILTVVYRLTGELLPVDWGRRRRRDRANRTPA